jgi:reactive intermediate/imine deaminase
VTGDIKVRTAACCDNIRAVLAAAGSSLDRVVKTTVFLRDMAYFADMNAAYETYFPHRPARSCVAVAGLPKGVPVEIECIALPGVEGDNLRFE